MSGVSIATGQRMHPETHANGESGATAPADNGGGAMFKASFLQVQLLAYVIVFLVSGLVPFEEIATAAFITVYIIGLSLYAFPNKSKEPLPGLFNVNKILPAYAALGSLVGLFLPLAYVLGGFTRNDQEAVRSAVPQLFLFCCQLLTENLIIDFNWISLPVRALVPLLYTARRLVTINMWLRDLFGSEPLKTDLPLWPLFGRALALANGGLWSFNLFFFVIPMFLPRAFEKHFEMQHGAKQNAFSGEAREAKPKPSEPAIVEPSQEPESKGKRSAFSEFTKKLI